MKYIRTKDKIYTDISWENHYNELGLKEKDYIIISDNIKELCDEFVYNNTHYDGRKPYIIDGGLGDNYEQDEIEYRNKNNIIIYGAIWTDKGLIYVAKMNDKGELELL